MVMRPRGTAVHSDYHLRFTAGLELANALLA